MHKNFLLVGLLIASCAFAAPRKSGDKTGNGNAVLEEKLKAIGANARILNCLIFYEFDFASHALGLSVAFQPDSKDGQSNTGEIKASSAQQQAQLAEFVNTGRLKMRPEAKQAGLKVDKKLAYRCTIIAETVIETYSLKMQIEQIDGPGEPAGQSESF